MDILNAKNARRYLALGPRASLVRIVAEGVETAGMIAARQGNDRQAKNYRAASRVLRRALALDAVDAEDAAVALTL